MGTRRATSADIPHLVTLALDRNQPLGTMLANSIPLDAATIEQKLNYLIGSGVGVVLLDVDDADKIWGGIGAALEPYLWNNRLTVAREWFRATSWIGESPPGVGVRLLRGFEDWARGMGAHLLIVTERHGYLGGHSLKRYLARRGFAPLERFYTKRIDHPLTCRKETT